MMANYTTVDDIKAELNLELDQSDPLIMGWIEAASDLIDTYCSRHFDKRDAVTRYFNGDGATLFFDDLLAVTTFKLDNDDDGTFEDTLAATDYILYPLNSTPKMWAKIRSNSEYSSFAKGVEKGVEIVGNWGYTTVPPAIRQACIIQVCRWHKRKDSGYATAVVGSTETGEIPLYTALDPDVKLILNSYRKISIGV